MIYFFVIVQRIALVHIGKDISKVDYVPMCGWENDLTTLHQEPSSNFPHHSPPGHLRHQRALPRHQQQELSQFSRGRPSQVINLSRELPVNKRLSTWVDTISGHRYNQNNPKKPVNKFEFKLNSGNRRVKRNEEENDHIDRVIKNKTGKKLVIISYTFSAESITSGGKKDYNGDSGDGDGKGAGGKENTSKGSSDVNFDDKNILGKHEQFSDYRERRASVIIPEKTNKMGKEGGEGFISRPTTEENTKCSCNVHTTRNFTLNILDVRGKPPPKSRLVLEVDQEDTKTFDVASFWDRFQMAIDWKQDREEMAKVAIRVYDLEKPTASYTLNMALEGASDLSVDCKSSSYTPTNLKPHPVQERSSSTPPPHNKKGAEINKKESSKPSYAFLSPFFIAAISLCGLSLIFVITALALFKRSRAYSHYITGVSKMTTRGVTGRVPRAIRMSPLDKHYEEIKAATPTNGMGGDDSNSRSGSRTRLGTLSLTAVRQVSSPSLNGPPGSRKNSRELRAVLGTSGGVSSAANITIPPHSTLTSALDPHSVAASRSTSNSDSKVNNYSIYEDLHECAESESGWDVSDGSDAPPPKPFLDRKSLMISRSHSTPANHAIRIFPRETGECSPSHIQHRQPFLRYSKSYTTTDKISFDHDSNSYDLKDGFEAATIPSRPHSSCSQQYYLVERDIKPLEKYTVHNDDFEYSSSGDDGDDDDSNVDERNIENNKYCDKRSSDYADYAEVASGSLKGSRCTDALDPSTCYYSEIKLQEEMVMFDNIIYQPSPATVSVVNENINFR